VAGDRIAGILQASIALHHRLGEVTHQGEQGHHRPQHRTDEPAPAPADQGAAKSTHRHRAGHPTQGPLHRLARGDRRQRVAPEAATDHIGADVGGHDQEAGQEGESEAGTGGPGLACQVGSESFAGQLAQANPVAGQKAQIEEPEDRGGDVGNRAGHRLQQQPATDHRPGGRQHGRRHIAGKPATTRRGTATGQLGADQQQLHRHQGGFGGGPDPLELGHPEKFQQAQVHDHPHGHREPPASEHHHHEAKGTRRPAAEQPRQGGGGAGAGARDQDAVLRTARRGQSARRQSKTGAPQPPAWPGCRAAASGARWPEPPAHPGHPAGPECRWHPPDPPGWRC